jgi:hypothetical protein
MRKEADELSAIVVNKSILLGEDFTGNLEEALCAYLNNLIDEELAKGDETDFDLIDEYADTINYIRENGADILPVISDRDFMKRIGIAPKSPAFKIAAIAAALAVIIGIGTVAAQGSPSEIARDVAKYFRELFNVYELEPVTEQIPETTTAKADESTTQRIKIKWIELRFGDSFRREYYVGESFDKTGLEVVALTTEGSYTTDDYTVKFDSPFAEKAGEQTVTVTAYGFSESFKVRILNNEKTPILNSIYATFPEGFDFTYKDNPETALGEMRVYAVYSSGEEKELEKDEYTVNVEETKLLFSKNATVRIEYRGCTSEFVMKGVLK